MKSFEYVLAKLRGGALSSIVLETAEEAKDRGKILVGAAKAKGLANKADTKQPQEQEEFVRLTSQVSSAHSPLFPLHCITESPLPALPAAWMAGWSRLLVGHL